MSRLTRDGTAESGSRDQVLRRERGQGNMNFLCSADHEQDWQPYPVDPHSCYNTCVTIHTWVSQDHFIVVLIITKQEVSRWISVAQKRGVEKTPGL